MKNSTKNILDELVNRYPQLNSIKNDILNAYTVIEKAYEDGNKILLCGNGGSASDSEHIVGELMKKFRKQRKIDAQIYKKLANYGNEGEKLRKTLEGSLRAVSLTSHMALNTAFSNDKEPSVAFAQQLYGQGDKGDVLISISTSGDSENCVLATTLAKAMEIKTIALTGQKESRLSVLSDVAIRVPEVETYKIQELHLPIYHCLCAMLEEELF